MIIAGILSGTSADKTCDMNRDFDQWYPGELEKLTGRKLTSADGFTESEISAIEELRGLLLPTALRRFYALAGKHEITQEHDRLYRLEQLELVGGKLVFMEENQCVVFWGVDVNGAPDPEVFQATLETPTDWYSEEWTFSEWIIQRLRWIRGAD